MDESLADLLVEHELAARAKLPPAAFDYIAAGAGDELSLEESRAAWRRYRLRPRIFRGGAPTDLTTEVLGTSLGVPVVVAPTAYHQVAHPEGEVETARGVSAADGLMVVTTRATRTLEEIAAALGGAWWYQVYVVRERRVTEELVRRAAGLGARALMLTVDTPYIGFKRRGHFAPLTMEQHLVNFGAHLRPGTAFDDVTASLDQDPTIGLETIAWLRDLAGLPVFVKGVLRADDAAACLDAGAAGVVVSNHGGRQLDRAVASAVALPEIVAAVEGRAPVLVDGGIVSGTDVFVALSLGATAAMIGRPILWGLAAGGAAGVQRVLDAYRDELAHAMGLAGVAVVGEFSRDLVV
ncbi:MAG: alpha-hydroxy acid oxidase [Candidatus Dormiibacterota bacterium]